MFKALLASWILEMLKIHVHVLIMQPGPVVQGLPSTTLDVNSNIYQFINFLLGKFVKESFASNPLLSPTSSKNVSHSGSGSQGF